MVGNTGIGGGVPQSLCRNFNTARGCTRPQCTYTHTCSVCGRNNHGATSCYSQGAKRNNDNNNQTRPPKKKHRSGKSKGAQGSQL